MNISQSLEAFLHHQSSAQSITPHSATRREKAESFANDVLPQLFKDATMAKAAGSSWGNTAFPHTTTAMAGTASTATSGLGSVGGIFNGVLGAANIATSWGKSTPAAGAVNGMAAGAMIGSIIPGIGTAIGAAAGLVIGGLLGCIKVGKHKDQKVRDTVRSFLVEKGVLAPDYTIQLANGSRYDIGIDGGPKAELRGRRPYEVDFNNPLARYAVSWLDPLIDLVSQGNEKVKTDFVGYFANAAVSNAKNLSDVRDNVNTIIRQFGISDESLAQGIIQAQKTGAIDDQTALVYLTGIQQRQTLNLTQTGSRNLTETDSPDIPA
jgi:hypothetical protein